MAVIALLSDSFVEKLQPRKKPYEIRELELTGFIVRIQPTGRKTFYCEYARGKRKKIGRTNVISVDHARLIAKKILLGYCLEKCAI